MPETTQAETPVATPDLEAALESSFNDVPAPKRPEPKQAAAPQESPADPGDEVSDGELLELPDDGPVAQSASDDEFEIVHDGAQVKLSREKTIELARQGFDYTQKTQKLAEANKAVAEQWKRVQQVEQMQTALAPELAQVKAVEAQLRQYQNVDWVQLATDNPLEYPKYRAQYDQLVNAYQSTVGQYQQKAQVVQQQKAQVTAQIVQQQREKLLEKLPTWRDQTKYQQGAQEVRDYLLKEGLDAATVDGLTDAVSVTVAWKAAQYDKLVAQRADRSKQLRDAPAVVKPGARQQAVDGKQEFGKFRQSFKAQGTKGNTRAQEGLLLERLNRAFKK
jgi:hypothetical protein